MYLKREAIMELRVLMCNRFCVLICFILLMGCGKNENATNKTTNPILEKIAVSQIPNTIVFKNNNSLQLINGVYHLGGKPFSGFIKEKFKNDTIKSVGSYINGKQQGKTITFFPNGKIDTERNYKDGKAFGKHIGYWENGHQKFDFIYINDKREGLQKQWYESGLKYAFLTFKNDQEDGMQKAWRENGKPYINYQAKEGHRYGLQKSNLCYTLRDQKIKFSIK